MYLLDDVLAAVDGHVAAWLVDHALCGPLLRGKTCIAATNSPALAQRARCVVHMRAGRIASSQAQPQMAVRSDQDASDVDPAFEADQVCSRGSAMLAICSAERDTVGVPVRVQAAPDAAHQNCCGLCSQSILGIAKLMSCRH